MRGAALMLLVLALGQTGNVTGRIESSDRVEGEIHIYGQARPFVLTFSTVYQLDGRGVRADEFWAAAKEGASVQVKSTNEGMFWVARRANIRGERQ